LAGSEGCGFEEGGGSGSEEAKQQLCRFASENLGKCGFDLLMRRRGETSFRGAVMESLAVDLGYGPGTLAAWAAVENTKIVDVCSSCLNKCTGPALGRRRWLPESLPHSGRMYYMYSVREMHGST
jgi:hypothetical protein